MIIKCQILALHSAICLTAVALGQTGGSLDANFSPVRLDGGSGQVNDITIQPDGKILLVGYFRLDSVPNSQGLIRLNTDGSYDSTFQRPMIVSGGGTAVALQADGKVLVGGGASPSTGFYGTGIARFNTDGSVDTSFRASSEINSTVEDIAIQPDGKILVAGGSAREIVRLNADGSLDSTFDVGSGATSSAIREVLLQPDGKILVAGGFNAFNGIARDAIARLLPNGAVDPSFVANNWNRLSWIRSMALQSDGKIVIGGYFTRSSNSASNDSVARLNADGSVDASFQGNASAYVELVRVDPFGRVLVAGRFTAMNGSSRNYIARLNPDGSLDTSFNTFNGPNYWCWAIATQGDGKVVVGGQFTSVYGADHRAITRLNGGAGPALHAPRLMMTQNTGAGYTLRFDTRAGFSYRLRTSSDLSSWRTNTHAFLGTGTDSVITTNTSASQLFWSVVSSYQ